MAARSAAVHRMCLCTAYFYNVSYEITIRYLPPTEVDATARRIGRTRQPRSSVSSEGRRVLLAAHAPQ